MAKRPWYLTTLLVLIIIFYGLGALLTSILPLIAANVLKVDFPMWYIVSSLVVLIIGIVGAVLVFKWKKMGVYLLTATALLSIALDYAGSPAQLGIMSIIMSFLPPALVYLSMKPAWQQYK